ncbi:MAG TPA: MFS transporter [Candidatus Brocadiia bacterium]|nr:MFS transporter [Candidatus Brocadiia bacterium]
MARKSSPVWGRVDRRRNGIVCLAGVLTVLWGYGTQWRVMDLLLTELGLSAAEFASVIALFALAIFGQFAASLWTERFGYRRIMGVCWTASHVILIPLLFLPSAYFQGRAALLEILLLAAAAGKLLQMAGTSGLRRVIDSRLPAVRRDKAHASARRMYSVAGVLCLLVLAAVFSFCEGWRHPLRTLRVVLVVSLIAALIRDLFVSGMPEPHCAGQTVRIVWRRVVVVFLSNDRLMQLFGLCILMRMAIAGTEPFTVFFMRRALGASPALVMLAAAAMVAAAALSSPAWTRMVSAAGGNFALGFSLAIMGVSLALWMPVVPSTAVGAATAVIIHILQGISFAGMAVCVSDRFSAAMGGKCSPVIMALFRGADAVVFAIVVCLCGVVIDMLSGTGPFAFGPLSLDVYRGIFAVSGLLFLVMALLCLRFPSGRSAAPVAPLNGAFLPLRPAVELDEALPPLAADHRLTYLEQTSEFGSRLTTEELIAALGDPSFDVRQDAAVALGRRRAVESVPRLAGMLKSAGHGIEHQIIWALGEIGDWNAVPALMRALRREDPRMRGLAVRALGKIGNHAAARRLLKLLEKDPDDFVRLSAATALSRMQIEAAVWPLLTLLENSQVSVNRREYAVAIGNILSRPDEPFYPWWSGRRLDFDSDFPALVQNLQNELGIIQPELERLLEIISNAYQERDFFGALNYLREKWADFGCERPEDIRSLVLASLLDPNRKPAADPQEEAMLAMYLFCELMKTPHAPLESAQ